MLQGKWFVKLLKYTFCFNMITYPSEENLTYQILTLKTGKKPKRKTKNTFQNQAWMERMLLFVSESSYDSEIQQQPSLVGLSQKAVECYEEYACFYLFEHLCAQ